MTIRLSWGYRINIIFQPRGTNILEINNVTNCNATTKNDFKNKLYCPWPFVSIDALSNTP
jgi:hypothetical protein